MVDTQHTLRTKCIFRIEREYRCCRCIRCRWIECKIIQTVVAYDRRMWLIACRVCGIHKNDNISSIKHDQWFEVFQSIKHWCQSICVRDVCSCLISFLFNFVHTYAYHAFDCVERSVLRVAITYSHMCSIVLENIFRAISYTFRNLGELCKLM